MAASILDEVYNLLENALRRLLTNRKAEGIFCDDADVGNRRSYFSTLEGLEALLIPLVNLPKNRLWTPLTRDFPDLPTFIHDDVAYVIRSNRDAQEPPSAHGEPYFTSGARGRELPYWTSECASFTISALINYGELAARYDLPRKHAKKKLATIIEQNASWVDKCKRNDTGWSWTYSGGAHPWPTWSLLDTFDEALRAQWLKAATRRRLAEACDQVTKRILLQFTSTAASSYMARWKQSVLQPTQDGQPYSAETALDLSRLTLGAALHRQGWEVFPLAESLFAWALATDYSAINYRFHLEEKQNYIYDSSLVPSVLRALIIVAGALRPRLTGKLDKALGTSHEFAIQRAYRDCQQTLIAGGEYADLWGVPSTKGKTYELYYTERTIEALTELAIHYQHANVTNLRPALPKGKARKTTTSRTEEPENTETEPPHRIDKYTTWVPELASGRIPGELTLVGWPAEDLFEYYVYRLFSQVLLLDGKEWGRTVRGKALPDGQIKIPNSACVCLYDAKSSVGVYTITIEESRKFIDYAEAGRRRTRMKEKQLGYFLVIGPGFGGKLRDRANTFRARTGLSLRCLKASDLSWLADELGQGDCSTEEKRAFGWERLLAAGDPVITREQMEDAVKEWREEKDRA